MADIHERTPESSVGALAWVGLWALTASAVLSSGSVFALLLHAPADWTERVSRVLAVLSLLPLPMVPLLWGCLVLLSPDPATPDAVLVFVGSLATVAGSLCSSAFVLGWGRVFEEWVVWALPIMGLGLAFVWGVVLTVRAFGRIPRDGNP